MERQRSKTQRGQILPTFAATMLVLLGITSLVFDVGWAHFTTKRAQTAADSAALAAISQAMILTGGQSPSCGTLGCQDAGLCPSSGNLAVGCQYATANGFTNGGDGGRQTVTFAAGTSRNAPGSVVPVDYWVQVKTQHTIRQWFSGLFTTGGLRPSAQATAAIRSINFDVSIDLLNRKSDCFASALNLGVVCGEDFLSLGLNDITAEKGIYMSSSNASGLGLPAIGAGTVVGSLNVQAPFTYLMGQGGIQGIGGITWNSAPTNGFGDGDYFTDPMSGRSQPPMPTGLPDHPVTLGLITGSLLGGSPTLLPPGSYYAASLPLLGHRTALGTPITVTGNVVFSDGQNPPCGGFCNYVIYGGLITGPLSNVTFSPGRYVFAGAQPIAGGPGAGFTVGANGKVQDLTPLVGGQIGQNTDAGEIFIFTDKNYSGLTLPADISASGISFPQARAGVVAGVNPTITLHGLNASSSYLPSELASYAPVLIWQDRANTTVKYNSNGTLALTCGILPCSNLLSVPGSQEMIVSASQTGGHAGTNLYGTIYGPRGSWLTIAALLPGDTVAGPLQIISGSLQMTLFGSLDLQALPTPPTRSIAALIQ